MSRRGGGAADSARALSGVGRARDARAPIAASDRPVSMEPGSPVHEQQEDGDYEVDVHRMAQRQKQIDFGKNTLGYTNYLQQVPLERRVSSGKERDPMTPDIMQRISKRQFDGQIKAWRRALHKYDPSFGGGAAAVALATVGDAGAAGEEGAAPASDTSAQSDLDPHAADKKRGFSRAFSSKDVTNVPNPGSRQRKASPPPPAERSNGRHAHQRGAEPTKHRHQQQQKQAATAGVAASGGAEENRERMCEDVFGDWEEV